MMALRAAGGRPHNYTIIRYIIMALELQNDLAQKIQSDNLSIASSNRLARGNLATAEQIQSVQPPLDGNHWTHADPSIHAAQWAGRGPR